MCFLSLLVALAPNLGTSWQWWSSPSQPECRDGWTWGEEEWRQADPHPDHRDSFHYTTSEKKRERTRRGQSKVGVHIQINFVAAPQSRNLSPWWQIVTATASDVWSCTGLSNISHITHAHNYISLHFKIYFRVQHTQTQPCTPQADFFIVKIQHAYVTLYSRLGLSRKSCRPAPRFGRGFVW